MSVVFKSIVVAFDGSAHASRALEIGATLAAQEDIPLGIIYVMDVGHKTLTEDIREMARIEGVINPVPKMLVNYEEAHPLMFSAMAQASAESERALVQYADFLLQQAEKSARHFAAARIDSKVVLGKPAEEIVAFARERQADLIVIGSRGLGRLQSLVLGSTASKVAQLAACSCLTVK